MNFPADQSHGFDGPQESNMSFCNRLIENFRDAAHGLGKYCAVKNEVTVRKGCKIYRMTCGKGWIRVSARSRPEIVIHLAPDVTVSELKRFFTNVIDSPDFLYGKR